MKYPKSPTEIALILEGAESPPKNPKVFTEEEAREIGDSIEIDWDLHNIKEFTIGLTVELEHGLIDNQTNITDDDPIATGKIALAHIKEIPDYYSRLKYMEEAAKESSYANRGIHKKSSHKT